MLCSSIIQISRGTEAHKYFLQAYTCLLIKKRSIVYIVLGNLSSNQVSSFTIILSWIRTIYLLQILLIPVRGDGNRCDTISL
jgi:hypothetical protein